MQVPGDWFGSPSDLGELVGGPAAGRSLGLVGRQPQGEWIERAGVMRQTPVGPGARVSPAQPLGGCGARRLVVVLPEGQLGPLEPGGVPAVTHPIDLIEVLMRRCKVALADEELGADGVQVVGGPTVGGQEVGGEPLTLRPVAGCQQLPGEVVGDIAAGGVFEAELVGPLVAVPRVGQGVAVAAGPRQREDPKAKMP